MRNIISLAHISLDGFMAGPGGDMSFIIMDNEGLPLFTRLEKRSQLELRSSKTFRSGVLAVHYVTKR